MLIPQPEGKRRLIVIAKYDLLRQTDIEKIHDTAIKILGTIGIKVEGKEALKQYQSAGATVDQDQVVKIPPEMIKAAVEKCRSRFSLYHRRTHEEMIVGDGNTKHGASGWTSMLLDWRTGLYRDARLADMVESVKLCGALDEVSWFMAPLICSDIDMEEAELYQFKVGVEHSNKPMLLGASDKQTVEKLAYLGARLAGGEKLFKDWPSFVIDVGVFSPLLLTADTSDVIISCAKLGIPMAIYSSAMAGATSPVTLSGTLAGTHAEKLAAIVLAKLVSPNIDIIYTSYNKTFDMQHADIAAANPEYGLLQAASVQLGRYINLPVCSGMLNADSPQLDMQAGIEKMGCTLLPLLSGADLSTGMGMLSKLKIHSLEALVIDAECVGYFNRMLKGIEVENTEEILEAYKEAGLTGEFLSVAHTLDYFRKEVWYPKFAYRGPVSFNEGKVNTVSLQNKVQAFIAETLDSIPIAGVDRRIY